MNLNIENSYGPLSSFASSITWSIGVAVYTSLSKRYPASAVNFNRALVALPLLLFTVWLNNPSLLHAFSGISMHQVQWLGLSIVASYALGDVLLLKSISCIGLPAALAIASTFPIWSALYGWIALKQPYSFSSLAGLLLIVAGTIVVILSGKKHAEHKKHFTRGVFLAFATSLFWSLNTISTARGGTGIDPITASAIRMSFALILCPVFGVLIYRTTKITLIRKDFIRSFPIFVIESYFGTFLFLYGLTHSPLGVASALSSLSPVITVPISWAMRWEQPSFHKTLGVIGVVLGIWLLSLH